MSLFKKSSRATLRGALGAPATPQQVINTKGHIDRILVRQAIINSGDSTLAAQSYSNGGLKDNHAIQKHDVTLGLRSQIVVQRLLNHPNLKVIASFNGFNFKNYPTDNHIARAFFFTGVALDIETYDANRKDSGLALQIGGIYTIVNTGSRTLKPGMLARWRPPPTGRGRRGGTPMSQLPQASWNPGDPRGKLPPIIEPYDPRDLNQVWSAAYATIFRSSSYADDACPGILGAEYRQLYLADLPGKMRRNTSHQDEAMAVKFGLVGCILQAIFALVQSGLLQGANGVDDAGAVVRTLVDRMGLFKKDPSAQETSVLKNVLAHVFWRHLPSQTIQGSVSQNYMAAFADGFQPGRSIPTESFSNDSANIARMFTDSLSVLGGMINGAAQEERNSILGKVLNEAMPGEGVAVCFGMRNQ